MAQRVLAILATAVFAASLAGATVSTGPAAAQTAQQKKAKGLKGTSGYKRPYSYSKSSIIGTETRRFSEPGYTRQTTSGPFDNGFFFDSAYGKNGGEAPYMQ